MLHAVNNVLVFVLGVTLGERAATEELPAGIGVGFALLSLASMAAYVAVVARSRRRLLPETWTAAVDLRSPVPSAPVPAH